MVDKRTPPRGTPAPRRDAPPRRSTPPRAAWPGRADPLTLSLLPLRIFLGFVFCYAGISKIADRRFLDSSALTSLHSQITAVRPASPIRDLLGPIVDHSFAFGLVAACAELAVGLGVLLGLLTRVAAAGGMLLALSLWLTISWQAAPWYTSADVVYLFALTPLLIGGAGAWSLDAWLSETSARRPDAGADPARRAFVVVGAALGAAALLGVSSLFRRGAPTTRTAPPTALPTSPLSGTNTGTSAPASGTGGSSPPANALVATSQVPVGGGKQVFASSGLPVWVLQLRTGQFSAVSGTCPHQGCPVSFVSPSQGFACPCHGSTFATDGSLLTGPATSGLQQVRVTVVNGEVVPSN